MAAMRQLAESVRNYSVSIVLIGEMHLSEAIKISGKNKKGADPYEFANADKHSKYSFRRQ